MNDWVFDVDIKVRRRRLVTITDFRIARGGITFLLGESGIGKTLLARAIFGLLDADDYNIRVNRQDYRQYVAGGMGEEIRKGGFFVFQEPSTHLNPLMTVRRQLQEGELRRQDDGDDTLRELWKPEAAHDATAILGLYPRPYRPSGGEKQRILLSMALKKLDLLGESTDGVDKGIFIFDEPTGSLDNEYRDRFVDSLLLRYRHHPFTILFITHDYSLLQQVIRDHGDLVDRLKFLELSSAQGRLVFKDFRPATYAEWIEALRFGRYTSPAGRKGKPLLSVDSRLTVLGRTLEVTKDSPGVEPCPLEVHPGRLTYLKAPSGTGKTTLAKAIMGLTPAESLGLTLLGTRLTESSPQRTWHRQIWGKAMTLVFQHADEALNMHSTVEETLRQLPIRGGVSAATAEEHLGGLFDSATVPGLMHKKIWMLSGGQKQRLNLVRGLFLETRLLILDEPLNGLDFESCTRVIDLLRQTLVAGRGILLISHNEEIFDALTADDDRFYLHLRSAEKQD